MATVRLNKSHKQDIVDNAIRGSKLNKQLIEHDGKGAILAEELRLHLLGGADEAARLDKVHAEINNLLDTLPDSIVKRYNNPVNKERTFRIMGIDRCPVFLNMDDYRIAPTDYQITLDDNPKLKAKIAAHEKKRVAIKKKIKELRNQVEATLASMTTLNKLLKAWPEVKDLLPYELTNIEDAPKLPALKTKELNEALGLPKSTAK